jgi:hypothetical protein
LGKIQLKDRAKRDKEGIDKRGKEGEGGGKGWGGGTDIRGVSLQDGWVGVSTLPPSHPFQFPDRMSRNMKKVYNEMD